MFCPYIRNDCNQTCIFWDQSIQDCLKRLGEKQKLEALSPAEKQKLTKMRKGGY